MGHAGDDYGTITRQGWHPTLKFAFSMMVNRWEADYPRSSTDTHLIFCSVWRALFRALRVEDTLPGVEGAFACEDLS